MKLPRNESNLQYAKKMRREMTKEELRLWLEFLRSYPVRFRRQELIGNYIVDFFCHKAMLGVELDGSQHYEAKGQGYDKHRDEWLLRNGIEIIRFSNSDIKQNLEGVCTMIDDAVRFRLSHPGELFSDTFSD